VSTRHTHIAWGHVARMLSSGVTTAWMHGSWGMIEKLPWNTMCFVLDEYDLS